MQTTILKKKIEDPSVEKISPKYLVNNGPLQVRLTLQALREGKVKIFDPDALKRSKMLK